MVTALASLHNGELIWVGAFKGHRRHETAAGGSAIAWRLGINVLGGQALRAVVTESAFGRRHCGMAMVANKSIIAWYEISL